MFYFSTAQIDEIEKRLAARSKKDTDFDLTHEASDSDLVAIIHNGKNMICRLDSLPGILKAVPYDNIPDEVTEEDILKVPTAFSISVLKSMLGIDSLPEFSVDDVYHKGDYVKHTDPNGITRGYFFLADKVAGYWDDSIVSEINYSSFSNSINEILAEFTEGGRVSVLESRFTGDAAKKAIADEDGKNIKQFYLLKSEIPEIIHDIEELIASKLDSTPTGSHSRPIYIKETVQTGYGEPAEIDSLDLPGDIKTDMNVQARGGVSCGGYADLSMPGGQGGAGSVTAVAVSDAQVLTPDAGGVIDMSGVITEDMEEYNPSKTYMRGESFYIVGASGRRTPYRTLTDMSILNYGSLERLTLKAASEPLNVGTAYIQSLT